MMGRHEIEGNLVRLADGHKVGNVLKHCSCWPADLQTLINVLQRLGRCSVQGHVRRRGIPAIFARAKWHSPQLVPHFKPPRFYLFKRVPLHCLRGQRVHQVVPVGVVSRRLLHSFVNHYGGARRQGWVDGGIPSPVPRAVCKQRRHERELYNRGKACSTMSHRNACTSAYIP